MNMILSSTLPEPTERHASPASSGLKKPTPRRLPARLRSALAAVLGALGALNAHATLLDPAAFPSLGPSPFVSGGYSIDTSFDNPAPVLYEGATPILTGVFYDPTPADPNNRDEIAVFTFDALNIPAGVTVTGWQNSNSRPIALLSQSNATIDGSVDVRGASSSSAGLVRDGGNAGNAGPGGGGGGGGGSLFGVNGSGGLGFVGGAFGFGLIGGKGGSVTASGGGVNGFDGGGGGFGGAGGSGLSDGIGGTAYGNLWVTLQGGSGGAGGATISYNGAGGRGGGGGGGAVEIGAVGNISIGGTVRADGGNALSFLNYGYSGGGGAGGGIIVHASTLSLAGALTARGGFGAIRPIPPGLQQVVAGGGSGGGGRVLIVTADGTLASGSLGANVVVSGGIRDDRLGQPGVAELAIPCTTPIRIETVSLPNTHTGLSYSQTLTASGGSGAAVFSAVTALPAGLSLSPNGIISGTPASAGNFTFSIQVASGICFDTHTYNLVVDGACTPQAAGVTSLWHAEGDAQDATGTNHGVLVGDTSFVPGIVGQAFHFDGNGDAVLLPNNLFPMPTNGTANTPFTFELWFKAEAPGVILGQQQAAAFANISAGFVPVIYVGSDGVLRFQALWGGTFNQFSSAVSVVDGNFHHVAICYDGTQQLGYFDGRLLGSRPHILTAYASEYFYQLGTGKTAGWLASSANPLTGWGDFRGLIDEPSVYDRVLTAAEVQGIFTAGAFGKCLNPPQITCPGNVSLQCAPPSGFSLTIQANVTDADHGQTLTVTLTEGATLLGTQTLVSPANNTLINFNAATFAPGVHALTATVSDGISSAQCAFTITVVADTQPPTVSRVPADATIECPATPVFGSPLFDDNCHNVSVSFGDQNLPVAGKEITKVRRTWEATDGVGNVTQISQTLTVVDTTAPVPSLASLPDVIAQCSATRPMAPTATDACDGPITATTTAPAAFGQGDFTIVWTFTDSHGNSTTQNQLVHVHDTIAPVPNLASLPDVIAQCSATRPAAPTATDACDGVITATTAAPASFGQGDFTIVWTFTDSHGNSVTQNQQVHVHDTLAPVLSGVPANLTVTATSASGAVVTFATPTASDACSGSVPVTCSPASGATFPVGTTTVACTATDAAGNSASASFTVTVTPQPPNVLAQINALITTVRGLPIQPVVKVALELKLVVAKVAWQNNQPQVACLAMRAFDVCVTEFRQQNKLTAAQATQLTTAAQNIRLEMGCP